MALSICNTMVDSRGRELLQHGTAAFPVACYHDDLWENPVPWHWHEEFEAVVISRGSCTVAVGKEKFTLGEGEGFFVNSGVLHGCWNLGDTGCRFHSLVFHPRLVGGSTDSVFFRDYVEPLVQDPVMEGLRLTPEEPWQKAALESIENAWQACQGEPRGYPFLVRENLSRVVLEMRDNLPRQSVLPDARARRDARRMKQMLSFIHNFYGQPMDTAAIAASAAISESECLRCFHTVIGTTPIQYLRSYRLRQAQQLLTGTTAHIADIAVQCGFQDVSYFTKIFRQSLGCTPSEYRKQADFSEI